MIKIDCFGDICPIPILKMQHELQLLKPGESFEMVVDHSCVLESINDALKKTNIKYEIEEVMNGVWEIIITKPL